MNFLEQMYLNKSNFNINYTTSKLNTKITLFLVINLSDKKRKFKKQIRIYEIMLIKSMKFVLS